MMLGMYKAVGKERDCAARGGPQYRRVSVMGPSETQLVNCRSIKTKCLDGKWINPRISGNKTRVVSAHRLIIPWTFAIPTVSPSPRTWLIRRSTVLST